jgi:hypothetical protein
MWLAGVLCARIPVAHRLACILHLLSCLLHSPQPPEPFRLVLRVSNRPGPALLLWMHVAPPLECVSYRSATRRAFFLFRCSSCLLPESILTLGISMFLEHNLLMGQPVALLSAKICRAHPSDAFLVFKENNIIFDHQIILIYRK